MNRSAITKLGITLLVIGGLFLWNTWVLGFLNHGLAGYTQMSISELNVVGQPFAGFFTTTEWLSGLFLLVGSLALIFATRKGGFMIIALLLTASIGALTIFDATHPLDCNRYQNQACQLKWARGEVTTEHKEHGIESEATDYVTLLLAVELVAWALYHKLARKADASYVELLLMAGVAAVILSPFVISSSSIVVESIGQRVWNTLTSILFLYIVYRARQLDRPTGARYSHRKTRKAIA